MGAAINPHSGNGPKERRQRELPKTELNPDEGRLTSEEARLYLGGQRSSQLKPFGSIKNSSSIKSNDPLL